MEQIHSEKIDLVGAALSKAQLIISAALKDTNNPFFKSTYADLSSVWSACRIALSENGLSVSQSIFENARGYVLITLLIHSSGQWIKSFCPLILPQNKSDMQALGSAITYARRYSLAAIVGVVQEDDDGNSVSFQKPNQKPTAYNKPKTQPDAQGLAEQRVNLEIKADLPDGSVKIPGAFMGRPISDLSEAACKSIIATFEKEYKLDKSKCSGIEYKETITKVRERLKEFETAKSAFGSFSEPSSVIIPKAQ